MTKLKLFYLLPIFFAVSCTIDYNIGESSVYEQERIIVNSYLNPSNEIRIHIHKLHIINNNYTSTGLSEYHIVLKENETILYDGIYPDSIFVIDYFPRVGCEYSIKVSYKGLTTVQAKTSIPEAIHSASSFSTGMYFWETWEHVVKLESFTVPNNEMVCLWITAYQMDEKAKKVQYNELYTKNVFVDKVNSVAGMDVKNETVGSIYHEGFLRIKNNNIPNLEELLFTPEYPPPIEDDEEGYSTATKIQIKLITASPEYDRYNKSNYEQKKMIIYDDFAALLYKPLSVYSNIENGLGIFAGFNEVDYMFDLPEKNF